MIKLVDLIPMGLNQPLTEGVDDPGILKAVFLAGGPGSGKSYTASDLFGISKDMGSSFGSTGLKSVNSDTAFEASLKKDGIDPKKLGDIAKNDPELWAQITMGPESNREKAKKVTKKLENFYKLGRLGIIIDGTGHKYDKIAKKKKEAEALGYDTMLVFVNTSLEVAKERNAKRDRVLPEDLLEKSWHAVQNNMGKFQQLFGSDMVIVDNTSYDKPADIKKKIQSRINKFLKKPIQNPIGKAWIKSARLLKKRK